ncbi:MAG: dienelactone hydrolase family protein [Acidimicrobiales bacterium]
MSPYSGQNEPAETTPSTASSGGGSSSPRNFSPWSQWMSRLAATVHEDPLPVGRPEALHSWLTGRRRCLAELLGPRPALVPPSLEVIEVQACDGYRSEKVVFDTEDTMSVPAYLLVPESRNVPGAAVLAIHGHGPGKSEVCGLEKTSSPTNDYGAQLARHGYLVLAPDLRCFGERSDPASEGHYACDTNLVHAFMAGTSPLTQNLWDLARSIDVLAAHPLVDPGRIGAVGLSYGATMTLFLAATDSRVAAGVVSGYFSSWAASHAVPLNMCGSQVLPGVLGRLEHVDLGALVAPRPLLIQSGTRDPIFPLAAAQSAVQQLRPVYEWAGASERLFHDVFEGSHEWNGAGPLRFLDRWLANRALSG